jgi:tRNA(Arg) A34 adenosine deaminase TadA
VTGNIAVGAAVSDADGGVRCRGRNRVYDADAPRGQVAGSGLAHAEINVLAQLPFRAPRVLVLTTTLQPCLQCAAAIRQAPISSVRFGGADPIWDGCSDFTSLSPWLARRAPVPSTGPRRDQLGVFATVISRFGPGLVPDYEAALRAGGEGGLVDFVYDLEAKGWCARARGRSVEWAIADLWSDLGAFTG